MGFFHSKQSTNFWKLLLSFFEASGRSQTLKIELKRCTVVQKRGSHLFAKNCIFLTKWTNNDHPWDPKDIKKRRKTWKHAVLISRSIFIAKSDDLERSRWVNVKGWRQGWGPVEGGEASPRSYAEDLVFILSTPCYL